MLLVSVLVSEVELKLSIELGADHLTFEGGGRVILEKKFLQGYSEQKNTCTNKLWKKYPAPVFGGEKMLQNSMVAGIDLTV